MRLNHRLKLLRSGALWETLRQLTRLRKSEYSPWRHAPASGRLRGIDFYRADTLVWVMASAMRRFHRKHGRFPALIEPKGFNDKVFWFKFFGELPVPWCGDKLSTHRFIPKELQNDIQCAPLVWHGHGPALPNNAEVPPGTYYLKANLGSDMFERITYPLDSSCRAALEAKAAQWLHSKFGLEDGEWWYNVFEPQLLLESSVCAEDDAISWNVYVLNGEIPMVGMFRKRSDGTQESSWLYPSFQPLPWQSILPPIQNYQIPQHANQMLELAKAIAQPFASVRVDFLQGLDGRLYLCELTFAPGNALSRRPPEVDQLLSTPWKHLQ